MIFQELALKYVTKAGGEYCNLDYPDLIESGSLPGFCGLLAGIASMPANALPESCFTTLLFCYGVPAGAGPAVGSPAFPLNLFTIQVCPALCNGRPVNFREKRFFVSIRQAFRSEGETGAKGVLC